jgi:hypothetical protein
MLELHTLKDSEFENIPRSGIENFKNKPMKNTLLFSAAPIVCKGFLIATPCGPGRGCLW